MSEQPPPPLSPRERECTRWVAEGKRDCEIATIVGIKYGTVRFHVNNAMHKHGVATRMQLVVKLLREGVLQ